MPQWKPSHPYIDEAVADTIEYVVTREVVHQPHDIRKVIRAGARRACGHYGMRLGEYRWVVHAVAHRLGV